MSATMCGSTALCIHDISMGMYPPTPSRAQVGSFREDAVLKMPQKKNFNTTGLVWCHMYKEVDKRLQTAAHTCFHFLGSNDAVSV